MAARCGMGFGAGVRTGACLLILGVLAFACRSGTRTSEVSSPAAVPYLELRAQNPSSVARNGPSPTKAPALVAPQGATLVAYTSGELTLQALFAAPQRAQPAPALLYLHGDFSLKPRDIELLRSFVDAGFAVMTPSLRGENGNPGALELLYGEVDDARAAARWLAARPEVDATRIHVLGHSVGGGLAALLSLFPEPALASTASIGGIYEPGTFGRWSTMRNNAALIRFDPNDATETRLRTLGPNVADMVHHHLAYVGHEDTWFVRNAQRVVQQAKQVGAPFELVLIDGGHMSSRDVAIAAHLVRLTRW